MFAKLSARSYVASLCFAIALCVCGCSTSEESASLLHQRGLVLLNQGKNPEALDAFKRAAVKDPGNPVIQYDIGVTYGLMDQFAKAIEAYTKALELDPRDARTLRNRAVAYAQLRQFKKSIEDCTRAIEYDPQESMAYRNRGLARRELGELEPAMADFNTAVRLGPQIPEGFFARASMSLEQRQYQLALQDCNEGLKLVPRHVDGLLIRGQVYRGLGKTELAEKDFKTAKELDPAVKVPVEVVAAKPVGPVPLDTQSRALELAIKYLAEHGYTEVKRIDEDSPCEIKAQSAKGPVEIDVHVALNGSTFRLSKAELIRLRDHKLPMHGLVVIDIDPKNSDSGRVLNVKTTWPPTDAQLTPVEFDVPAAE